MQKAPELFRGLGWTVFSQSVAMTPASPGVVVAELNPIMQWKLQDESDTRHPVSNGADTAAQDRMRWTSPSGICYVRNRVQPQGVQTLATGSSPVATSRCARLPHHSRSFLLVRNWWHTSTF
ncbi:hypothetical protein A2J03_02630 [Rhodococcus sp. EPR-157]|nr:hypothetical protein A2J03_02630 [Rhodococcus sp. EPR-157]